ENWDVEPPRFEAYLWNIRDFLRHKLVAKYAWGGYLDVLEDHVDPDDEVEPEEDSE
ncbi:hypothetical protein HK104_006859, partial [Borealophlyctis nickersoniae]